MTKTGVAWLLAVIIGLECVAVGYVLLGPSPRPVAVLPDVTLADPLIMPQLQRLAQQAEQGSTAEWTTFAEQLLAAGFYAHAELAFREAISLNPDNFAAQFGLAFCLDRLGQMEQSTLEYRRAMELKPATEEESVLRRHTIFAMGRNALRLDQADLAMEYFQADETFPASDYQAAQLLIRSDRAEQALPLIAEQLKNIPFSLAFHYLNYRAQLALGNEAAAFEAAAMLERSAYLVSLSFNTQYVGRLNYQQGLSRLLVDMQLADEQKNTAEVDRLAAEIKKLSGDLIPFNIGAFYYYELESAIRQKQPQRVFDIIAEMRATGRQSAAMLDIEGDAWQMLGKTDQALELWERAVAITPDRQLHEKLADYYEPIDPDRANQHRSIVKLMEGIEEYRSNRLLEAIVPLKMATNLDAENAAAWFYLGEMRFYRDQFELAADAYRQCLNVNPNYGAAIDRLNFIENTNSVPSANSDG